MARRLDGGPRINMEATGAAAESLQGEGSKTGNCGGNEGLFSTLTVIFYDMENHRRVWVT